MSKYAYKPYDPRFPALYRAEEARLRERFGGKVIIEHIGSTSVPGLGGKGIVDILLAVPKGEMTVASRILSEMGYQYSPDSGGEDRLFHSAIVQHEGFDSCAFHVHVTYPESKEFRTNIAFRDYLLQHPSEIKRYSEIKQQASKEATKLSDRKVARTKYLEIKGPVIEEMLQRALAASAKSS